MVFGNMMRLCADFYESGLGNGLGRIFDRRAAMAITDALDREKLESIKQQLQPFMAALEVAQPHGVAESFQVWTASLSGFRESGAKSASPEHVWHHQLRPPGGRADAFALSIDDSVPEVRAVYHSSLAEEIDRAAEEIDKDPAFHSDKFVVRLLEVPDVNLSAIWILKGSISQYVPLGEFASPDDKRFVPISEADLKARLPERPVIGISDAPPSERRPDFEES
jgi:hypothetical protein